MSSLAINLFRNKMAEYLNRVADGKERMTITRKGKIIAAIVPVEDLQFIEALEDHIDLRDAIEALKEPGSIPWEVIKQEHGL